MAIDFTSEFTGDAPADASTDYSIIPDAIFGGRLDSRGDEDWIRVEFEADLKYDIILAGQGDDGADDTILTIYNAFGEVLAMNDDVDRDAGILDSYLRFYPDYSGVYYLGVSSYSGNPNQENWGDYSVFLFLLGGPEYLEGTEDAEVMTGTDGDDVFEGSPGADTIWGGAGFDLVDYRYSGALEVRLYDGTIKGDLAEGDTFPGRKTVRYTDAKGNIREASVPDIEGLLGSTFDDVLAGAQGADWLKGSEGDDELDGREGDDVLEGGPGADVLIGGPGNDTVSYDPDNDTYGDGVTVNLSTGEAWYGDADGDTFPGKQTIEYVDEEGNLQQAEVSDIENLRGTDHHFDELTGTYGPNRLEGLDGADRLYGLAGDDVLEGGADDDYLDGGLGNDKLDGGDGDDGLKGGPGNDRLDGGSGDDGLEGGPGADSLRGGAGNDSVRYSLSKEGVEVRLYDGVSRNGDAEGDTFSGWHTVEYLDAEGMSRQAMVPDVEILHGSEHDDILVGDARANKLYGEEGNDVLSGREGDDYLVGDDYVIVIWAGGYSTEGDDKLDGGPGDDWLEGGAGADELIGGPGVDTASYKSFSGAVEVRLYDNFTQGGQADGDAFVSMQTVEYVDAGGKVRTAQVPDIENLHGSTNSDTLAGAEGPNKLEGYYGNDTLDGREGDDRLYGGEGADILIGGPGADLLSGGPDEYFSTDTASYETSASGVVVRLHSVLEQGARGGDAEGDIFVAETHAITDDEGNTREVRVPDIENLAGSEHDDILAGDFRGNILRGEGGNDKLYGGPEGGADILFGGAGNDQIYGGTGYDWLFGGLGDDLLKGGADTDYFEFELELVDEERSTEFELYFKTERFDYGNDRMEGGAGADFFYFYPDGGDDAILDFGNGKDRIVLSAFEDIRTVTDLTLEQQGDNLLIDLTPHGGGTITLHNFNETDLTDAHFAFFTEDMA